MLNTAAVDRVIELLHRSASIVLTTHVNPDGDGLGSELALFYFLKSLGKHAFILNHSPVPDNYAWLNTNNEITTFDPAVHCDIVRTADAILIVDTNQSNRLRSMEACVLESPAAKVIIDHHLEAQDFAQHYLTDEDATSTGEIVYHLLTLAEKDPITSDIAKALYTAIMTDTGSFRFPRTDAETHRITANLIECGADPTGIYASVYESWPLGRMRLLGEVLDSIRTEFDGALAYVVCTKKMFEETGTSEADTDNFTTYPMSVAGVRVGILINELADGVKISFRSKGEIPINQLAKEFGGNGHLNAAGARVRGVELANILPVIIQKAAKYVGDQRAT